MNKEFSYNYFVTCLLEGDHRELSYKDYIIVITSYPNRVDICIEHYGTIEARQSFLTVQECLSKFNIDGKTIKDLWDDLCLA